MRREGGRNSPDVGWLRHTVPRNDLNELRLHLEHLLPSNGDEVLADEHPIFGVKVGREPG